MNQERKTHHYVQQLHTRNLLKHESTCLISSSIPWPRYEGAFDTSRQGLFHSNSEDLNKCWDMLIGERKHELDGRLYRPVHSCRIIGGYSSLTTTQTELKFTFSNSTQIHTHTTSFHCANVISQKPSDCLQQSECIQCRRSAGLTFAHMTSYDRLWANILGIAFNASNTDHGAKSYGTEDNGPGSEGRGVCNGAKETGYVIDS